SILLKPIGNEAALLDLHQAAARLCLWPFVRACPLSFFAFALILCAARPRGFFGRGSTAFALACPWRTETLPSRSR
ncbi:hypothetical protein, partial [Bradyrhizobium japonicum]